MTANHRFEAFFKSNILPFNKSAVKSTYHLDAFPVDLDGNPETAMSLSRYYLQLFSHQRDTEMWKGMLQVQQDEGDDNALLAGLIALSTEVEP